MVVFGIKSLYSVKVIATGRSGGIRSKRLYLGKSGSILKKVVVYGQSGFIRSKRLYLDKSGCTRENGCIRAMWLY